MRKTMTTVVLGAALAMPALAGPERVAFPEDFADSYVLYLQVDRPDRKRVRLMYVDPAAHAEAKAGEPLPDGTVLVMADKDAELDGEGNPVIGPDGRFVASGDFTNVFVMEKRAGWGATQPPDMRNGDWDYAWYLPDGTPSPDAEYGGCFGCHAYRADRDFTFTYAKFLIDQGR